MIHVVPAAACIKVRCLLLLLAIRPAAATAAVTEIHTAAVTIHARNAKKNINDKKILHNAHASIDDLNKNS